jgi:hypothetical protein
VPACSQDSLLGDASRHKSFRFPFSASTLNKYVKEPYNTNLVLKKFKRTRFRNFLYDYQAKRRQKERQEEDKEKGHSLESFCQEGRLIFFIFFQLSTRGTT